MTTIDRTLTLLLAALIPFVAEASWHQRGPDTFNSNLYGVAWAGASGGNQQFIVAGQGAALLKVVYNPLADTWTTNPLDIDLKGGVVRGDFMAVDIHRQSGFGLAVGFYNHERLRVHDRPALIRTTDHGASWEANHSHPALDAGTRLWDVAVIDQANAIAVGDRFDNHDILYRTSDAGNTWNAIPLGSISGLSFWTAGSQAQHYHFRGIDFSGNTGVIVGHFSGGSSKNLVLRSTDAGLTWEDVSGAVGTKSTFAERSKDFGNPRRVLLRSPSNCIVTAGSRFVYSLDFTSTTPAQTFWKRTGFETLPGLATVDPAETSQIQGEMRSRHYKVVGIAEIPGSDDLIATSEYGTYVRARNGGIHSQDWSVHTIAYDKVTGDGIEDASYYGAVFADSDIGLMVGRKGALAFTTDAGASWTTNPERTTDFLTDVVFADREFGLAVGDRGSILQTIDGGLSWERRRELTVNTMQLNAIAINRQGSQAFVGGTEGIFQLDIFRPGGTPRIRVLPLDLGMTVHTNGLAISDAGTALAVGADAAIWRQATPGGPWTQVNVNLSQAQHCNFYGVDFFDGSDDCIIVGCRFHPGPATLNERAFESLILQSDDGGVSWSLRVDGGTNNEAVLRDVSLSGSQHGFAVGYEYPPDDPADPDLPKGIAFLATIKRTTDGGVTWQSVQNTATQNNVRILPADTPNHPLVSLLYSVEALNSDEFVACGGAGMIVHGRNINWPEAELFVKDSRTRWPLRGIAMRPAMPGVDEEFVAVGYYGSIVGSDGPYDFPKQADGDGPSRPAVNMGRADEPYLWPAQPNPFDERSDIRFVLPSAMHVSIRIFDYTGREVAILLDDRRARGRHHLSLAPGDLPSGVYFCRMEAGGHTKSRTMMLMR